MNIIPAIDLIHGQCVRLQKGDFSAVTQYQQLPQKVAQAYEMQGAQYLHVVDLDGAKNGRLQQFELIQSIRQSCQLIMQVGGGVKDQHTIETLLNSGVDRVVLGSIAVKDVEKTKQFIKAFGVDKLVLALDVHIKNHRPMVATHGWLNTSDKTLYELLDEYLEDDLRHVLCTDISKDGILQGANNHLYQSVVEQYSGISFQASGGVGSLKDLVALKQTGVQNVIIGRALYENQLSLREALAC